MASLGWKVAVFAVNEWAEHGVPASFMRGNAWRVRLHSGMDFDREGGAHAIALDGPATDGCPDVCVKLPRFLSRSPSEVPLP